MKKLVILALLGFAGFKFYQNGFSFTPPKGAFDKHGNPRVILFVGPDCMEYCDRVRSTLEQRGVAFEEISVTGEDGAPVSNPYGVKIFPTTLVGKREVRGSDTMQITSALAEHYGEAMLTPMEKAAMGNHFDASGRAKVVMYGTSWCPYCKKQREYFVDNNIPYEEIDVEESESNRLLFSTLQGGGYPLIYVGYRRLPGYNEKEVLTALQDMAKAGPARR